ncbi:MAG: M28 family peptidase [Planctomycetota bacterium]
MVSATAPAEVDTPERLRALVERLSTEFADRDPTHPEAYAAAADMLAEQLRDAGVRTVERQTLSLLVDEAIVACDNLIADIPGRGEDAGVLIVGAHYDTIPGTPGANDNASGVAGIIELARRLHDVEPRHTIRLVLWANEEPPYFQTPAMGSVEHAQSLGDEKVIGAISLDMIGYFDDAPGSQEIPEGLVLPGVDMASLGVADFLVVLGEPGSAGLVETFVEAWDAPVRLVPAVLPKEVGIAGLSDHWAYWQEGYPAVQITDTSFLRYDHYHQPTDTPEKLDYDCMAAGIAGIESAVRVLAGVE